MTQYIDGREVSNNASHHRASGFLRRNRVQIFGASLLGILAVAGIANAGPIARHSLGCMGGHHDHSASDVAATPNAQGKVAITADASGFHPSSIEVTKGQKTILEFRRTSNETCATSVVFPDLKLEKALPLNQTVAIELPTNVSSTLTFQCGMGMYHGKLVVR